MTTRQSARGRRTPFAHRWADRFLAELARTSNVTQSAKAARVALSTLYGVRRSDVEFARAWHRALAEGYDLLEMELLQRLREGQAEDEVKGGARRKFDNGTALRLLAAHRASVDRERARQGDAYEEELFASIEAKLAAMRASRRAALAASAGNDAA